VRKTIYIWTAVVLAGLVLESWAIYTLRLSGERWRFKAIVKDEPAAHALYDRMFETMRSAKSLSYEYSYSGPGEKPRRYLIWLKKPNYFRVEAFDGQGWRSGTLVGDGNNLWVYWPGDCPLIDPEDKEVPRESRSSRYVTRPTGLGRHSIGHVVPDLGRGMGMPIVDPSTFHGYTDSLQPYIDGVAGRGTDRIGREKCDVIEVSIMNAQRTWYFWLSQEDHLPRRIKQIIRGAWGNGVDVEDWSHVAIDAEIAPQKFVWSPPADWQRYVAPDPEGELLKAGEVAPDFELQAVDGGTIKLSDYRDKVVWLYVWRSG
jgi:outer membrane lipoprotein-sorting protein